MTPEKLKNAIQTVKVNIDILQSEKNRVGTCPGIDMQLELEIHILYLLEAEYEGRLHINSVPEKCFECRSSDEIKNECNNTKCFKSNGGFKNGKKNENSKSKKRLFCLGHRNK